MSSAPDTKPQRRPRHDPADSEREILEAAEQLLRERPFRELTIEEVMSRTALKRPAFYAHFRDRHDLVLRVAQQIAVELFAATNRWLQGGSLRADALSGLEGIAAVYAVHGPVIRALADAASSDEAVEAYYRTVVHAFTETAAEQIRAEQAAGRANPSIDAAETARALLWLNERYYCEALGREPRTDPQQVAAILHRIWIATVYGENT